MKRSVTSDSRGCRRRRESIRGQKVLKAESHSQYHPLPPPCLYLALSLIQVPSLSALSHLPSHTNGGAPAAAAMWVLALSHCSTPGTEGWKSKEWSRWRVGLNYSWQRQAGRMTPGGDRKEDNIFLPCSRAAHCSGEDFLQPQGCAGPWGRRNFCFPVSGRWSPGCSSIPCSPFDNNQRSDILPAPRMWG